MRDLAASKSNPAHARAAAQRLDAEKLALADPFRKLGGDYNVPAQAAPGQRNVPLSQRNLAPSRRNLPQARGTLPRARVSRARTP